MILYMEEDRAEDVLLSRFLTMNQQHVQCNPPKNGNTHLITERELTNFIHLEVFSNINGDCI